MKDDLKRNGRQPKKEMEHVLKKNRKNGRQPKKTTYKNGRQPQSQFKKSTLIGCDIIVN
jgi:hypothetical protein